MVLTIISTMDKKYKCYSCQNIVTHEDLAYECMCLHSRDETAQYRGICTGCEYKDSKDWSQWPGQEDHHHENHHLHKVHKYPEEFSEYWKMVDREVPKWMGFITNKDNTMTFFYSKDGQNMQKKLPSPPSVKCTCCC